jgi:hypothetical protein
MMTRVYTKAEGVRTGGYAIQKNCQYVELLSLSSLQFDALTCGISAAYATDPKLTLKYSGHVVDFRSEYPPLLRRIQDEVEHKLGITFDHVMLNMYEDGSVYIGRHRDNIEER